MLLNPNSLSELFRTRFPLDERSFEIMGETAAFFQAKGKKRIKEDDHRRTFYADFIEFQKRKRIFATLLTPRAYGFDAGCRWDTWRNCHFNEILGFFGLAYWYTWQVSILGLGPIWMSKNEAQKNRAAELLLAGNVFAFGLSERAHGADIYATEMCLIPQQDGTFRANGEKYYIGNANIAPMVSTFGKFAGSDEYVFFTADFRKSEYDLLRNVTASQNYVAQFALRDYPIQPDEILSRGQEAWDSALNTVNVGKFNLGWASIGICTHALYEAVRHTGNRRLYNMFVTDFPHVQQMFSEAYARLLAMKLFSLRAADYMRVASNDDRRYLLYNPMVKMKVTTQGEEVINLLWDVIAAKGFERDTYFEMAARDIRALPKLEGTVHVNIALILKFILNYFFFPKEYPAVARQAGGDDDTFLFNQGAARGLGQIHFHDFNLAYQAYSTKNLDIFKRQVTVFKDLLAQASPTESQQKDIDFLIGLGEIFALVVYGQLILENASIYGLDPASVDQIFDFMVRDFSRHALNLMSKPESSKEQIEYCRRMIERPEPDAERFARVWEGQVLPLKQAYELQD